MNKKQSKVMRAFQIKMMTQLAQGKFQGIDLKNELFVKWLVGHMAESRIPFKVVPLGGGVTRIVHSGGLCPLCSGSGVIHHADECAISESPSPEAFAWHAEKKSSGCGGNCSCKGGCSEGGRCCKENQSAA
ncbi:MAG: hypothetical protein MI742_04040 [Desulfobacterales bacterium]|nr:hypothetical protein [Desulfobacterales bacterium]